MQTNSQPDTETKEVMPLIYGRFKGIEWFNLLRKRDIIILGLGGIGSWLALQLSRNGANLYLYDMDKFEAHNGGQVMFRYNIGASKAAAIKQTIADFSPDCKVETFGEYKYDSATGRIVLCGPDNFSARRMAFENWERYVQQSPEQERKYMFFQDGRLLAEQMGIFSIPGDRPDLMELYRSQHLFSDEEGDRPDCTSQQTTHMAARIASQMIVFLCNWITNAYSDQQARKVPFCHEYFAAINLVLEK